MRDASPEEEWGKTDVSPTTMRDVSPEEESGTSGPGRSG